MNWPNLWTDNVPLAQQSTFPRLALALLLGAMIGAERQWRQRAAGLRTNTLVCLGAAAFVDLGATLAGPGNTGVIAYVVSGVGFLGAGAIIKDGASIRGLNTAATLWCSAAVGASVGAGELLDAGFVTALLIVINLLMRPLSRFIDKQAVKARTSAIYTLTATCSSSEQATVRTLCLEAITARRLVLRQLRAEEQSDGGDVEIYAEMESPTKNIGLINEIANILTKNTSVSSVTLRETPSEVE